MVRGRTITMIDPESGEEDEITVPVKLNGRAHGPDANLDPIQWYNSTDDAYVIIQKTGRESYLVDIEPGKKRTD